MPCRAIVKSPPRVDLNRSPMRLGMTTILRALRPFTAPAQDGSYPRMLLKNSQIEQMRKSRSHAHSVV